MTILAEEPEDKATNSWNAMTLSRCRWWMKLGRLLGRITIDDAVDAIIEDAERDYQLASGISEDVESSDSVGP